MSFKEIEEFTTQSNPEWGNQTFSIRVRGRHIFQVYLPSTARFATIDPKLLKSPTISARTYAKSEKSQKNETQEMNTITAISNLTDITEITEITEITKFTEIIDIAEITEITKHTEIAKKNKQKHVNYYKINFLAYLKVWDHSNIVDLVFLIRTKISAPENSWAPHW